MAGLGSIQLGAYRKGLAGHLHDLVHDKRDVSLDRGRGNPSLNPGEGSYGEFELS